MNIFKVLGLLPQLVGFLTGLVALVRHVEDVAAPGTTGQAKKDQAVALLVAAVQLAGSLGIPEAAALDANKVATIAAPIIDAVVGVLNALGVFKHSTPPAPPAA